MLFLKRRIRGSGQTSAYRLGKGRRSYAPRLHGRNGNAILYRHAVPYNHSTPRPPLLYALYQRDGVRDVYEITKVYTITGKEAKNTDTDDAESKALRLAFELRFVHKQYANYLPVETNKWIGYTFIDTTFDKLDECVVIDKN